MKMRGHGANETLLAFLLVAPANHGAQIEGSR
jgi:hypothetical protein